MFWSRRPHRFREAAAALGMSLDSDRSMSGRWRERVPLKLVHATESQGDSQVKLTLATATMDPPLFLGLKITKRSAVFGGLGDALGMGDFEIGVPDFDRETRVYAPDPAYVTEFLRGPLTVPLTQTFSTVSGLEINDHRVRVRMRGHQLEVSNLRVVLEGVGSLAAALLHRKAEVPLPTWHAHVEEHWGSFARDRRLHLDAARCRLSGHLARDVEAWVQFCADPRKATLLETHLRIKVPVAATAGLQLKPESGVQSFFKFFGAQDVKTSDSEFDDVFVVKATNEEAALRCLNDGAREMLIALRARCESVTLDEHGLHMIVRRVITYGIDEMVDYALDVAMSMRHEGPHREGPYR